MKRKTGKFLVPSLAAFMALAAAGCGENAGVESSLENAITERPVIVRFHTDSPSKLRKRLQLAGYDVSGSSERLGFVDVVERPEKFDFLIAEAKGRYRSVERLEIPKVDARYTDTQEMSDFVDAVVAAHPDIAARVTLVDASGMFECHELYAVKISDNVSADENEPAFLFECQLHAREVMTGEVCKDAIDFLTSNYGTDPQVTSWVDNAEIWIIPQANPDGVAYVFSGDDWWRTNRHKSCGCTETCTVCGVDQNRNFEWNWRQCPGYGTSCGDETYSGESAASEPETQAIKGLMEGVRPLYYIDYHSYGEYIVWPSACGRVDEHDLLRIAAELLNQSVETDDGQTGHWTIGNTVDVMYSAPGGSDDHAYGAAGAMAYTIELNSTGFHPDYAQWRDVTVQRQRAAWGLLLDRTINGPSIRGRVLDADTLQPVVAQFEFADHPQGSGQWPLKTDQNGWFARVVMPDMDHTVVFSATGYLPEVRQVTVGQGPVEFDVYMHAGTNHAPTVSAGPDITAPEGSTVALQAAGSDPDGNTLFYRWTQLQGPPVLLRNATSATPDFFAPGVDADTLLEFEVVASDGELESQPDTVQVTIQDVCSGSTDYAATDTPIVIPDNDTAGISSTIHVGADQPVVGIAVTVNITHTYIGDLLVRLTSPSGTTVILHDHEGGSADDIHSTYSPAEFLGEPAMGDWLLEVFDTAGGDSGTLDDWTITLDDACQAACSTDADCAGLPNVAAASCVGQQCTIDQCSSGYADCYGRASDGCETDTSSDPSNCGSCGNTCTYPHAQAACNSGSCQLVSCIPPWQDCNGGASDGCETDTSSDPSNCGSCGTACSLPNAQVVCQAASCAIAACDPGWGDCNGDPSDGCEHDTTSDPLNCGNCGVACGQNSSCNGGTCTCDSGYADCDTAPGCETILGTIDDCTGCGDRCVFPNAQASCGISGCTMGDCLAGFGDCDSDPANGCEADLGSDPSNCGSCGNACSFENAESACEQGSCMLAACTGNFADCDGNQQNGCEADLRSDPLNCGSCGTGCNPQNAQGGCDNGSCVLGPCDPGFGNCNADPADGCEIDLRTDPENCGGCGNACSLPNATAGCSDGSCTISSCDDGFGDCNENPSDGCETNLRTDAENCGACGTPCDLEGASSECRDGRCVLLGCLAGHADCNGDESDGCEAELNSDPSNCRSCGHRCEFPNATGECAGGSCRMGECLEGFADCNADSADGCETDIASDADNCGSCGLACRPGLACQQGKCVPGCDDADSDGHPASACGGDDCDDGNPKVHPGAGEACNGIDDDCDGQTDEGRDCPSGGGCGCSSGTAGGGIFLLPLLALGPRRRRGKRAK